ncbi:hypothetical protein [Thiobacter aerophilum]|uniref:Circularly permuted type 2 ATP-grasp protein n=1 Tax=Thiobacter aerophilum TaxID=3121275 RepID=A0ABV0EAT3_9BURK
MNSQLPHATLPLPVSAESLNRGCACRTLDPQRLRQQLEAEPSLAGLYDDIAASRPTLFSATTVFISPQQYRAMAAIVSAVETVVALPAYQEAVLARAPAIARLHHGPRGVFMGFDFHLGAQGPQLIEINTNAGGALLNAVLARAQAACCREMEWAFQPSADLARLEETFLAMFREEWRRQRGEAPLARIAIVDDDPAGQYLYPEFKLFERLFARAGITAVIADPGDLAWRDGRLWHDGKAIDLIYNRLTDFYLDEARHAQLRQAYEAGAVVLTPHPRAHALYADKRNLILLSDAQALARMGAPSPAIEVLQAGVPRTEAVTLDDAERLWAQRRGLFFKPASGYGSKAAYRGDKLTRRVWQAILAGDYVAQTIAPPSERLTQVDGHTADLKVDVRAYVYAGQVQLLAARLYAGQTTNFRTPGGGFAPVFVAPETPAKLSRGASNVWNLW